MKGRLLAAFAALIVPCAAALSGCSVQNTFEVSGSGDFTSTPPGRSAVLHVTTPASDAPDSYGITYSQYRPILPDQRFAEFLALAAAEHGGMDVLTPRTAARALEEHEIVQTLQPDPGQLRAYADALGISSYLTGDVTTWGHTGVYILSVAQIRCRVACHVPGREEPLWEAEVHRRRRGASDVEVARAALRQMFEWLKTHGPPEPTEAGAE